MRTRRKVVSAAFTGVAAMGAVGLGTGVAHASGGTWTITPGGAYTGANSTNATLTANGTPLTCAPGTATATGTLQTTAAGTSPVIGSIATATFGTATSPCTLAGVVNFTAKLNNPLNIKAQTYNAATGVTKGEISGPISATLTGVGTTCTATVTGTVLSGSFNNGADTLDINPSGAQTLTIHDVSGCNGLIANSEKAGFQATYIVSPPQTIVDP